MYFTNAVFYGKPPNAGALIECVDSNPSGTSAGTVSCQTVSTAKHYGANVSSVIVIGAGKPKSGGSGYSGFYFYGSIDGSTMGVYQTYDHFQTFTKIGGNMFQGVVAGDNFPGRFDQPVVMVGDSNTQGLVYLCFSGTACIYGQFN
jgi:hypothetical protein